MSAALQSLHVLPRTLTSPSRLPERTTSEDKSKQGSDAVDITNQQEMKGTQLVVKQETTTGCKREASVDVADSDIEVVSSKRVKSLPTWKDEVIILD